jgi:DNA-binding GntR family transcriptional regulator
MMNMTSETAPAPSQALSAYRRVRQEILRGMIAPGSKLHIGHLCDRLDVRLTPVREALNRLASEGLLVHTEQRGFRVAALSLDDLADLTEARVQLNELALRSAIANGGEEWEEQVLLAFHRLLRTPRFSQEEGGRNPAWESMHRAFHTSLISACASRRIREFCEALFDSADRYRHAARVAVSDQRPDEAEHRALMEATIARDADHAVALLTEHVRRTESLVRQALPDTIQRSA